MNIHHDIFYHHGNILVLICDVSEITGQSTIKVIENGYIHDIYCCEYPIQDVRFVQEQVTNTIMITWLARLDGRHKHSGTYLLSFDENFVTRRVDLLQSDFSEVENNTLPIVIQFDNVLLLSQISLAKGRVSLSLYDIKTLRENCPVTLIKECVSYDFFHHPEKAERKFNATKIAANEAVIMFYNEFEHRSFYRYTVGITNSIKKITYK
ncbi:hypothetical protein [Pseudescherichia sp.]|uniref:hypothetical protein n=1 Tax=Pseudescherichia sp. TaxID=2055881 RepID=UPI00289F7F89|nr:hypothetical protein [Pseudescherichia sp.]